MAIAGPNYKFITAECGINGRVSDGSVWFASEIYKSIYDLYNPLNLPVPHLFVGDGAFPLSFNLFKLFQGSLVSRFKVLIQTIEASS